MNMKFIILLCLFLSGCLSSSPIVRYYLLTPQAGQTVPATQTLSVEISAIRLPQYLDRSAIVTQTSRHRLRLSEDHQWAGNLRKNMLRVLALNLSSNLHTNDISITPNRTSQTPDFRVDIDIMQFELNQSGQIQLTAQWRLFQDNQRTPIHTIMTRLINPKILTETDYDNIVQVMGDEFAKFAQQIAQKIQQAQ